jgi:hypothetical protein
MEAADGNRVRFPKESVTPRSKARQSVVVPDPGPLQDNWEAAGATMVTLNVAEARPEAEARRTAGLKALALFTKKGKLDEPAGIET